MQGKQVDPEIPLGGLGCTGITLDYGGNILVSDGGRGVDSFSPDGRRMSIVGGVSAQALALDKVGNIHLLISQGRDNYVARTYRPDGKVLGQISMKFSLADGIAVDDAGRTFVLSQGHEVVRIFTPEGQMLVASVKTGSTPRAIALRPDGRMYVANFLSVTAYGPDGFTQPPLMHRNPDAGGIDNPMALGLSKDGSVYVGYESGYVGVLGPDGKPKGDAFMTRPEIRGIAVR
jgi:DNA-binding beta-propeller fold protein YncE